MSFPRVAIIILNWNGFEDTVECLDSLKQITYPNYEIIIVDNASSGNDVALLREKYDNYIHVIANETNAGFPEGCNIGMRYALGKGTDYCLLLNNDTKVDRGFLDELVKVAEADPSIGITGSKTYYYYNPNKIQSAGGKIIWWLGIIKAYGDEEDTGQHDRVMERDFLYGTSFLIKASVVNKISFMDPSFFFGVEEFDYCMKAKKAGFKIVYVPSSMIWHKVGASREKLPQYPETEEFIKRSAGESEDKYYAILFRRYLPPIIWAFPYLLRKRMWLLTDLLWYIRRRDWQRIKNGLAKRLKLLPAKNSKS